MIEGFNIGLGKVNVSHIQFTNDPILFLFDNGEILKCANFLVNFQKSLRVEGMSKKQCCWGIGIHVGLEIPAGLASLAGFVFLEWPLSYLGVPL